MKTKILSAFLALSLTGSLFAAQPPKQSTPEELLWRQLSDAARKSLTAQTTWTLMETFMKKYPDHPKAINVRYLYSERDFREKEYKKAAAGYEKFMALFPDHELADSAAYRMGESYYNLQAFNSAYSAWERVARDYKHSALVPNALEQMALIQMRNREWGKADEIFKQMARNYPHYSDYERVKINEGIVQYYLNDLSESAQTLEGISDPTGAYYRGLSLFSLTLFEDAVGALQKVHEGQNNEFKETAQFLKAEAFFQKQNYNLARKEFSEFIQNYPKNDLEPYARLRMAACSLLVNELDRSLKEANQAMRDGAPFEVRLFGQFIKGAALMNKGDYKNAATYFGHVAGRDEFPNLAAESLLRKAWCHKQTGDIATFIDNLKKLEERHPASPAIPTARYILGGHYYEAKKWEDAGSRFETSVLEFAYHPLSEAALAMMAISYSKAGRQDHLVTAASSALKLIEDNYSSQSLYWRAQSYFFIGKAYYDLKRFKEAIPYFENINTKFADHPLAPRSQLMLAWSYTETKKFEEAREQIRSLLEHKKASKELKSNGEFLMSVTYFNDKKYDKALVELNKFVKAHPTHDLAPRAQYLIGLSFHQKDVFGSAIEEWSKLIKSHPDHPLSQDAYLYIGDLYFKSGDYEKAAAFLRDFRKKWPTSPYSELAFWQELQAYFNGKKDEVALGAYKDYLNQFPDADNTADARKQLEMVYYRRGAHGDPAKLAEFLSAYPQSPFAPAARYKLGDMAMEQKKWSRAAQEMEQFLRDYPKDKLELDALYSLGVAYEKMDEDEKAIIQYNHLMEEYANKKNAVDAAFRLGSIHFKKERYKEAADAFEFATKKKLSGELKANVYYNMAIAYENLGELEKSANAYGEFTKYSKSSKSVREALLTAGVLMKKSDKGRKAIPYFKKLITVGGDPEVEIQAINLLAETYRDLGQKSSAIKTYEKLVGAEPVNHDLRLAGLAQLAYMLEQKNDLKEAIKIYEKIAVSDGKDEWVNAAKERVDALVQALNPQP